MTKTTEQIKCMAIYLRKSRAEDGIKDLEKHKEHLINICNENGWDYELYEEIESSVTLNRPELQRMRKDISKGKVDAVMVNAVDRLSRKTRHFLEIIEDYFMEQGITRLYVKDQKNELTDNTVITLLSIQATLSQSEYSFIVKRLNEGLRSSVEKGVKFGKVVYGYRLNKEKNKLEIVPEEGKVVREIIDLLLIGDTYGGICDKLNLSGVRTRKGNLWDVHNIKSIINSPTIRGHLKVEWKDGTETVNENIHEALMNDAEYYKIKELVANRAEHHKGKSKAPKHFLQGILTCPKCGKVMVICASKKSKYENNKRIYLEDMEYYIRACRNQVTHENCGNTGMNVRKVEDMVRNIIKSEAPKIDKKIQELLKLNGVEIQKSHKEKIERIEKSLKAIESKEENLLVFLEDGTVEREKYTERTNKLKEEKIQLQRQLQKAKASFTTIDIEVNLKNLQNIKDSIEMYDELDNERKRQLVQMLFKKIEYRKFKDTYENKIIAVAV